MGTFNEEFLETHDIIQAFAPGTDLQAAVTDGDWINMTNWDRCSLVVISGVGPDAAQVPILTPQQATDIAGAGAKAINIERIQVKALALLSGVQQWTTVTQTAAATYSNVLHGDLQTIYVTDILATTMDFAGGFSYLNVTIPDAGANAGNQYAVGFYILSGAHYGRSPSTRATNIV